MPVLGGRIPILSLQCLGNIVLSTGWLKRRYCGCCGCWGAKGCELLDSGLCCELLVSGLCCELLVGWLEAWLDVWLFIFLVNLKDLPFFYIFFTGNLKNDWLIKYRVGYNWGL